MFPDLLEESSRPLTSVNVPHHDIRVEAASLMLQLMNSETSTARTLFLPVKLVVREPTDPVQTVSWPREANTR